MAKTETALNEIPFPCVAPSGREETRFGEKPLYAEGLYDLGNGIYSWMVPNGSWGESNAGLVVGDDSSLLIDTLWDQDYTREMLDAMKEFTTEAPVKTLVNTHADGDHYWGNFLLRDVDIIASESTRKDMNHHQPRQMALFGMVGGLFSCLPLREFREAGHWMRRMCKPYNFKGVTPTPAKRSFKGNMSLNIGGRRVDLIEVGPAHRPGDTMVHIPDAKVLFTADILFIGCTPVMWQGPVENWIKALDMILEMDVETIVPGHGPFAGKDDVKLVREYWEYVNSQARKKFEEGRTAAEAAEEIVLSPEFEEKVFSGWDSPERIMTNCHILYRGFSANSKPMKPLQIISMMKKQAVLANRLPDASPRSMRLG